MEIRVLECCKRRVAADDISDGELEDSLGFRPGHRWHRCGRPLMLDSALLMSNIVVVDPACVS